MSSYIFRYPAVFPAASIHTFLSFQVRKPRVPHTAQPRSPGWAQSVCVIGSHPSLNMKIAVSEPIVISDFPQALTEHLTEKDRFILALGLKARCIMARRSW